MGNAGSDTENDAREFREELARLRLRQSELAEELGVHPVTVSRWAHGVLPVPQYVRAYLAMVEASIRWAKQRDPT